ncbi:MAG: hypothetical protein K9H64_15175 [Bacteroidales bacterium]|nr:hypothetical protein [Bacteroidales bacterium]MCF8457286.1 hypothetical protein [Bacteroidales bacterium]
MPLNKGKHIVQEIDGVLCTVVESGINSDRLTFLKELLEFNQFEVKVVEVPGEEGHATTYTIGVTDLVFNPVIAVYEKSLKHPNGRKVSPASWDQEKEVEHLPYFDYREKNPDAVNEDDFVQNPWAYRTV